MDMIKLVDRVLREPMSVVEQLSTTGQEVVLVPKLLALVGVGAGAFGAVVGSYRGGVQVLYAAAKMPILLLVPVILTLPAALGLARACHIPVAWRQLAAGATVGMARTAILSTVFVPLLWLFYSLTPDYHFSVLLMAALLCLAGLPGMAVLARALPKGGDLRAVAALGTLAVLGISLMQTGWLLRPFIARPTTEVSFLRPVEGDVLSSMGATMGATVGEYQEWEPRSSGFVNRTRKE